MPLSIRIISSPSGETVSEWNKQFPEEGGEIGRAYGSTLQLSDASREISGTHAMIKKSARGYQVVDNSTNGLFINGAHKALGKGNQTTLTDGDVLNVGQYRLLVSCFVPEQAAARHPSLAGSQGMPFSDDPFANAQQHAPAQQATPRFNTAATTQSINGRQGASASQHRAAFQQNAFDADPFQENTFATPQHEQGRAPLKTRLRPEQSSGFQQNQSGFGAQDKGGFGESGMHTDDPFSNANSTYSSQPSDAASPSAPYSKQSQFSSQEHMDATADLSHGFSDDPFVDGDDNFPSFSAQTEDVFEPVGQNHRSVAEYVTPREHEQQCVEKAMELALGRLLEELSPDTLEGMFNDLVRPSFFGRKPKYWDMYKRYFQRQVTNRDWQIKFGAYFKESYRMLKVGDK
ncbi:type VI secretion system-associated FHA domain protein [Enterovibrio norvegicus]|uniref:type VI secretion system-associated FHA domain protein n=1 Tax=Enterovibrio norvegicus TaxID=188144 RepID=UPI001F53073D|nr:FHA domain-containing protein [Enterovibrio norvegicus]